MSGLESIEQEVIQSPAEEMQDSQATQDVGLLSHPVESRQRIIKAFDKETSEEMDRNIDDVLSTAQAKELNFLQNAKVLIENGEYSLAINILRELLFINPKNPDGIRALGQCFMGQGKTDEAIKCFRSLLPLDTSFDSLSMLAEAYYEKGDDDSALNFYMKSLEVNVFENPMLFQIYKNIGNIYVRAGDYDTARENYNKAFTLNPDSDVLLVNFGTLEIQLGQWEKALEHFRNSVTINPYNDKGWLGLALVHREYGDHTLAWANIEKALDYQPTNALATRLIVDWSTRDGKTHEAIRRLENYLEKDSLNYEISMLLAQMLYEVGRFKHAAMELERALSIEPCSQEALELQKLLEQAG